MKFLLFIPFIVLFTQAFDDEWKRVGFVQPLMLSALVEMGYRNCSHLRESIEVDKRKALDCLAEIKSNNSFCYTFVDHFGRCTNNLVEKIESCITFKKQGLPTLFVNSIVTQMQFICGTDGEHILEIVNPCVFRTISDDEKNCTRIFDQHMRKISSDSNTKLAPGVCREISDFRTCISEPFKTQCQNAITRNTFQELFHANANSCKEINEV